MCNHDLKIRDTWESYKWIAKDYIFEFTGDADYRDNKLKKDSYWQNHDSDCFLKTDFLESRGKP